MKKIAKLSLVAAVAVAGLTNVNAASLEESIKGVDVSGQFRFRAQEKSSGQDNSDVEIEVGVKVPVTDTISAVFKIDNAPNKSGSNTSKAEVDIEDYYFAYNEGNVTVQAGQQDIPGRMTDGHQGDGIVALYNMAPFTVGAAAFMNHDIDTINDARALSAIAMGNFGPVSLLGQFTNVEDVLNAYNLKADAKIEMVTLGVEYTALDLDSSTATALGTQDDDRSTFKAYIGANVGIVSATATYAKTGDNGSGSMDNLTMSETETPSEYLLWNLGTAANDTTGLNRNAEVELYAIDASVKITDKISLRGAYAAGEIGNGPKNDVYEALGQVSYKVAKNLNTYVRYAEFDNSATADTADQRVRVEAKYTF